MYVYVVCNALQMTVISERFRCGSWCQVRLEDILGIAQSRCPKDPGDGVTGQKKYGNVML